MPIPPVLATLYADLEPVDRNGWLWRMPGHPLWFTRASGLGTFGPREAHALDAALLAHLVDAGDRASAMLFVVSDSAGHEATRSAEAICVAQYFAQHAAVLSLLRAQGVRVTGLLTGSGRGAAFFVNGLQGSKVYAVPSARVIAMEPSVIARVTGLDPRRLDELIESDPLIGIARASFRRLRRRRRGAPRSRARSVGRSRVMRLAVSSAAASHSRASASARSASKAAAEAMHSSCGIGPAGSAKQPAK